MDQGVTQINAAGFKDITRADIDVIACIPTDGARANDIVKRLKISKQAVSQKVESLERRGYIRRANDRDDGRSFLIKFTKRGLKLLEVALSGTEEIESVYADRLGNRDFRALKAGLHELCEQLDLLE